MIDGSKEKSNIFTRLGARVQSFYRGIAMYFKTVVAYVRVRSPHFEPLVTLYVLKRGKVKKELKSFRVPFTDEYEVDLEYITDNAEEFPSIIAVEYPNEWEETVAELKEENCKD